MCIRDSPTILYYSSRCIFSYNSRNALRYAINDLIREDLTKEDIEEWTNDDDVQNEITNDVSVNVAIIV